MGLRLYLSELERKIIVDALVKLPVQDLAVRKLLKQITPEVKKLEVKKEIQLISGQSTSSEMFVVTNRPNRNDCWNVALALGCNESYEKVRKNLGSLILRGGGTYSKHTIPYMKERGYETIENHGYKTPLSMARDTKSTSYEYLVYTTGHLIYMRHGKIYDSFSSERKRIAKVLRRKISKKRIPIHCLVS